MLENPWISIGESVVATAIISTVSYVLHYVRNSSGELYGEWNQVILNTNGEAIKTDYVKCRHRGTHVTGYIRRFDPADQSQKTWRFTGEIRNKLFFGIYWTDDSKRNPGSYGTLQLYITHEGLLEGFYVRLNETQNRRKHFTTELATIPLRWERRKRSRTIGSTGAAGSRSSDVNVG